MEQNIKNSLDPNYVPEDLRTPFDVLDLPSQGLLYDNKLKQVKVEYLTAMDENILSSPNLSAKPDVMIDLLIKRKVKDLNDLVKWEFKNRTECLKDLDKYFTNDSLDIIFI